MSDKCPHCNHPAHGGLCGYALTETFRDDVGWYEPPTGAVITEIVGTCKCIGIPMYAAVEDAIWQALDSEQAMPHSGVNPNFVVPEFLRLLNEAGYAIVKMPTVAFKGPLDTDHSMLRTAAERAEGAKYIVGGSNVGRAVGQVLRAVAEQMDQKHCAPVQKTTITEAIESGQGPDGQLID